jgi:hypothetical protein
MKTFLYKLSLLLLMAGLLGCSRSPVELRPFPYPYKAGLALCSDIDDTDSSAEFLAIQEYLCTTRTTRWGRGLGLEIGNSFWFYSPKGPSRFNIFDTTGQLDSLSNRIIQDFIRSGYIDCLHTWGDFNDSACAFKSEMAGKAAEYFARKGLTVAGWINHGNHNNRQCLGLLGYERGDNPGAGEYNVPYLEKLGVRYIETWNVTHRVSLERRAGLKDAGWQAYELLVSLKDWIFHGTRDLVTNGRLLNPIRLDDGRVFWRFRRFINADGWMSPRGVVCDYLTHQLKAANLDRLVKAGGYQIVYTHLGANPPGSDYLSPEVRGVLKALAERCDRGEILVTTTTRLLDYNLAVRLLRWKAEQRAGEWVIEIESLADPLHPESEIPLSRLMGITFYTPDPAKTHLFFEGRELEVQINPPDHTGRPSVEIPWPRLVYPAGY